MNSKAEQTQLQSIKSGQLSRCNFNNRKLKKKKKKHWKTVQACINIYNFIVSKTEKSWKLQWGEKEHWKHVVRLDAYYWLHLKKDVW